VTSRPAGRSWGRSGARAWLARRTLRGRLIAGLLALLAVACATIGIVTYVVLNHTLIGQVDAELAAAGGRYATCIEHNERIDREVGSEREGGGPPLSASPSPGPPSSQGPKKLNCSQAAALAAGTLRAGVKNGAVTNLGIIGDSRPARLTPAEQRSLTRLRPDGRFTTIDLVSVNTDFRLTATRGRYGDVVITGVPLTATEATLRKVELAEIIVFAVALLLTGVIGTGWVRLSLRPLRRVAATATRVTELPLASGAVSLPDRVPDTDPRTEVGQVGTAFNRMLGHVEAALARRAASEARLRRFAADASHELRTPLSAIRGYAELARRSPGPVPQDLAHALSRVEAESARMSELVDELLLLAQLDAGRPLATESVDLTRLAIDATSDARAASPGHRWQLELPGEPVMVRGDEHRLQQVLANLLGNAAKHTPAGTTVTVALTAAEPRADSPPSGSGRDAGTIRLSVTDDGPGIPGDLQPALFERFVRGDAARSSATGSTGLGLAIVDAVITAHGGTVSVASRPGRTSFVITLPRLDDRSPRGPDGQAATAGPAAQPAGGPAAGTS
jgi:two-component system, OmpR family, sensor kinase